MKGLEIEPELRAGIEGLREEPRGFWRHAALATNNFVDPLNRYADVLGKGHLGDFKWLEELPLKYLAWMRRDSVFG